MTEVQQRKLIHRVFDLPIHKRYKIGDILGIEYIKCENNVDEIKDFFQKIKDKDLLNDLYRIVFCNRRDICTDCVTDDCVIYNNIFIEEEILKQSQVNEISHCINCEEIMDNRNPMFIMEIGLIPLCSICNKQLEIAQYNGVNNSQCRIYIKPCDCWMTKAQIRKEDNG